MLVGEIGIDRRAFLYDMRYWEVLRIIKGYRKRGRLRDQLIAEAVFAAMHTMRDSKGKTVKDFFPILFEDDEDREPAEPISEEDYAEEQNLMRQWNMGEGQEKAQK